MFSALKYLVDTIISPIRIIVLIFEMLINLLTVVGNFFVAVFQFLPVEWSIVGGILVTIAILYKILGRESNG